MGAQNIPVTFNIRMAKGCANIYAIVFFVVGIFFAFKDRYFPTEPLWVEIFLEVVIVGAITGGLWVCVFITFWFIGRIFSLLFGD